MQEPFLYIEDISKANKKPFARAPQPEKKPAVVKPQKTTAAPSSPTTTPSTKTSFGPSARAPAASGKWEWWTGDGVPEPRLGYEQGPEGGWRRRPGSGPGQEEGTAAPEESKADPSTPAEEEETLTEQQQTDEKVVSSGATEELVSSAPAKVEVAKTEVAAKDKSTASSIESKKRNAPKTTVKTENWDYTILPREDNDGDSVWVVDNASGVEYDITDDSIIPEEYSTLEEVRNDHMQLFEDGEDRRRTIATMRYKMGQKPADPKATKVAEKKDAVKEEIRAAQSGGGSEKSPYKKTVKKDPVGTQSAFAYGDKKKPTKSPTKAQQKAKDAEVAEEKAKAPAAEKESKEKAGQQTLDFEDSSKKLPKKPSARAGAPDPRREQAIKDNKKVLDAKAKAKADEEEEEEKEVGKVKKEATKTFRGKRSKESLASKTARAAIQGVRTGRLVGTRIGEAAAVADAGGYLLSSGVEYGIGGALAAGHHLLKDRGADPTPSRKPAGRKPRSRGSEVEQSSMKSLPLYLDLNKAIQMPNAGGTTPDDKTARNQHLSSYAKRPVGVSNDGIVTEDDPDKGKRWTHSDEDSVQAEVDSNLSAVDEEEEEKEVGKAIGLLKSMNVSLQTEIRSCLPNDLETSFMIEELGYDPIKVSKGQLFISGRDRHRFNEWTHARLAKSIIALNIVSGLVDV